MLRLSLQCVTLPIKPFKLPFKSFSNVWREYSLKVLSHNISQWLKYKKINCTIISEDHVYNGVCVCVVYYFSVNYILRAKFLNTAM